MIVFRLFSLSELREAFKDILSQKTDNSSVDKNANINAGTTEGAAEINHTNSKFLKSLTLDRKDQRERIQLTEKHKLVLRDAYLHPYEKYYKQENAKRQINIFLKKEIKERIEKTQQDQQMDLFSSSFERPMSRSQTLRSPK